MPSTRASIGVLSMQVASCNPLKRGTFQFSVFKFHDQLTRPGVPIFKVILNFVFLVEESAAKLYLHKM